MTRKILSLIVAIILIACFNIAAQLPETSTAVDPIWYYIQVKGEGDRAGRVFSVNNNDIYGGYISDIQNDTDRKNYLFRFEKNGEQYSIISRLDGKNLNIRTAPEIESNFSILTLTSNAAGAWELIPQGNYFQIKSSTGDYAHQANSGGNRNFVTMTVDSEWSNDDNSYYHFVLYDNSLPQASTTENHWYYIKSGNPQYSNMCVTDITDNGEDFIKFELQDLVVNNRYQQWKLVSLTGSNRDAYYFINRETENIIQTAYDFDGYYTSDNFTGYYSVQTTQDKAATNGWRLNYIEGNQFTISGLNDLGILAYLNVASTESVPEFLPANIFSSVYSWTFKEELDPGTGIEDIVAPGQGSDINIYTVGRKIVVEGTEDYTITNISGIRMSKNHALPVGIYIVNANGITRSILVR